MPALRITHPWDKGFPEPGWFPEDEAPFLVGGPTARSPLKRTFVFRGEGILASQDEIPLAGAIGYPGQFGGFAPLPCTGHGAARRILQRPAPGKPALPEAWESVGPCSRGCLKGFPDVFGPNNLHLQGAARTQAFQSVIG